MKIEFEQSGMVDDWVHPRIILSDEKDDVEYPGELLINVYDTNDNPGHSILLNNHQITELIMHLEELILKQI
jgi:hypothetical protein